MPKCPNLRTICLSAVSAFFVFPMGSSISSSQIVPKGTNDEVHALAVIIWTDHQKYSLQSSIGLNASLQNTGDQPLYVDRRMFWTGFGGGLKLEISDEHGKTLPARVLSDAIMPPPKEGDTSILIRLDRGFFYGTSLNLLVRDFFPKPGRYSIRVMYKSWLRKEFVPSQLRDLPAVWAEAPEIVSEPIWIEVVQ